MKGLLQLLLQWYGTDGWKLGWNTSVSGRWQRKCEAVCSHLSRPGSSDAEMEQEAGRAINLKPAPPQHTSSSSTLLFLPIPQLETMSLNV